MLPQQFQHAHVLPHSEAAAVPIFQPCSQFAKRRRKFPLAVDVRVIQSGRASTQRYQIMQRIENLVARFIAALMRGHDLITVDDLNAIDVALIASVRSVGRAIANGALEYDHTRISTETCRRPSGKSTYTSCGVE